MYEPRLLVRSLSVLTLCLEFEVPSLKPLSLAYPIKPEDSWRGTCRQPQGRFNLSVVGSQEVKKLACVGICNTVLPYTLFAAALRRGCK